MANQLHNLLNIPRIIKFLPFCWKSLVCSILFDEKYFVYRSIIHNYKKNSGIKGSTTLMKVTGEQSIVWSFLGFSRNVSGQKLLVYHFLILIHSGAKLYSQRRANLKILNSAPRLLLLLFFFFSVGSNFISLMNTKILFSLVATATRENTAFGVQSVKNSNILYLIG